MLYQEDLRDKLSQHLKNAKEKNDKFSLRAFALKSKVSPGSLSLFLSAKRSLSPLAVEKIIYKLNLSNKERDELLEKLNVNILNIMQTQRNRTKLDYTILDKDKFSIVAKWQYFAILNLFKLNSFKSNIPWMAQKLNLSIEEVQESLEHLLQVGLVVLDHKNEFKRIHQNFQTNEESGGELKKKFQRQFISKAMQTLKNDSSSEWTDFSTVLIPTNPEMLLRCKDLIRKFHDDIIQIMETGNKTEVYTLSMQLFPLSRIHKDN